MRSYRNVGAVRFLSARDETLTDVHPRIAHGVLLDDLVLVEQDYDRLLVALRTAMNQVDVGDEIRRFRFQPGEFVLPGFVAAVGGGRLDRVAVEFTDFGLCRLALDQLAETLSCVASAIRSLPTLAQPAAARLTHKTDIVVNK